MYNLENSFKRGQEIKSTDLILKEEVAKNKEKLEEDFRENFEPISDDLEKIALSSVKKINSFFRENNIEIKEIILEDLSIFSTEEDGNPYYDNTKEIIVIPDIILQNSSDEELEAILVHEIYHSISRNKLNIMLDDLVNKKFLIRSKVGYRGTHHLYNEDNYQIYNYFSDFNEGVTDTLTYETLKSDEFINYKAEVLMVRSIIKNVYPEKGKMKSFLDGYFNGNTMHLREIENGYGEGSLILLASIQTDSLITEKNFNDKDLLQKQLKFKELSISFFVENDLNKRGKISEKINNF